MQVTEPDLLSVGKGAALEEEAFVMTNSLEGERLKLGPATIEQRWDVVPCVYVFWVLYMHGCAYVDVRVRRSPPVHRPFSVFAFNTHSCILLSFSVARDWAT